MSAVPLYGHDGDRLPHNGERWGSWCRKCVTPNLVDSADPLAEVERLRAGINDTIPYLGERDLAEPILRAALAAAPSETETGRAELCTDRKPWCPIETHGHVGGYIVPWFRPTPEQIPVLAPMSSGAIWVLALVVGCAVGVLLAHPGFAIPDRGIPDVWKCPTGGKPNGHPAEKPIGLVSRILTASGLKRGALVLDPFAGSGTTAVAAKALGLRCVAIEAEEKWCELIASRLDQGVLDLNGASA